MINEKECTRILNQGEEKFTKDEVKLIREFLLQLATIQYEHYKENRNIKDLKDERNIVSKGIHRRAS